MHDKWGTMLACLVMTFCVVSSQAACVTEDEGVVSFLQQEVVKHIPGPTPPAEEQEDDDSEEGSAEEAASPPKPMSVDASAEEADSELDSEQMQPIDYSIPKQMYRPSDDGPRAGVWTDEPNFGNLADLTRAQLDLKALTKHMKEGQMTIQALEDSKVQMMSVLADMGGHNQPTKAAVDQQQSMVAAATQRVEEAQYNQLLSRASTLREELSKLQDVPEINSYNNVVQEMQALAPKVEEIHKSILQNMGGEFAHLRAANEELLANLADIRYKKKDDLSTIAALEAERKALKAPLEANQQLKKSLTKTLDSIGEEAVKIVESLTPA
mmetsp:Transcript_120674/g.341894  ORF Transcript_120674/g.341894 Transcript_120674/m.341894 type:complete len:325 (+) Transcript_120674:76-1050(+)